MPRFFGPLCGLRAAASVRRSILPIIRTKEALCTLYHNGLEGHMFAHLCECALRPLNSKLIVSCNNVMMLTLTYIDWYYLEYHG